MDGQWDLTEAALALRSGKITAETLLDQHLQTIALQQPRLNCFVTLDEAGARAQAKASAARHLAWAPLSMLDGIPIALKDNIDVAGLPTSNGTAELRPASNDATVTARLRAAGAVLLGKTNLTEFALGASQQYGPNRNPWDLNRFTGGSSGGSGSATAAFLCATSLGEDTGGSIRRPAAWCGLAGLRPSWGRVSRYGVAAGSWSMDQVGPISRTVEDAAITMNVIAGYDPKDVASAKVDIPDYTTALTGDVRGLRIGMPKEYFEAPLDPQVRKAVLDAVSMLESMGAVVKEVSFPMFNQSQAISSTVLMAEASAYHRDLLEKDGHQLYEPVRQRLEAGLFISAADYLRAQQARALLDQEGRRLLDDVDLLAGPTEPVTAPQLLAERVQVGEHEMGTVAALTQYSRPYNLTGFPAIAIPCGFSESGMPISLQLAGRPFDELTVLRAAHAYEQATDWHKRRPPI